MFRRKFRRSLVVLVAPMLGATFFGGPALAGDGCYPYDSGCVPCPPLNPCEVIPATPNGMQYDAGTIPQTAPTAPIVDASEPAVDQAPPDFSVEPTMPNYDLSSGLASNFGRGGGSSLAFADALNVTPGYIESAVIQSRVRVRYDNMQGANKAGRAGFIYPALGVSDLFIGGRGPDDGGGAGVTGDVDLQTLSTYVEVAIRDCFSLFLDVPVRWIEPLDLNNSGTPETERGGGDISAGFRWGWIACPDEHLTCQVRTTLPTGEALRAIGTGNTTIDVGLLYDRKLGSSTRLFAELNDWQTLDAVTLQDNGGGFSAELLNQDANILRAGLGLGVDLLNFGTRCKPRKLTILAECVTWTILDGSTPSIDPDDSTIEDAVGDTIVNGKYGLRLTGTTNSVYVGYGHNWSSERWYSDLFRLEYQYNF